MKRSLSPIIMLLAVVLLVAGCQKMQTEGADTAGDIKGTEAAPEAVPAPTSPGTVGTIVVADTPFSVEYAVTDEEKARGLMDRESIPPNGGMWFVFSTPVQQDFWMKDTLIPLDIIFVGEDMKIVSIAENAVPKSVEMISSDEPFMYVLELNAGKVAELGIKVGDKVEARIGPKNE